MSEPNGESVAPEPPVTARPDRAPVPAWLRGMYAGVCLYFFLSAINVMGSGLKIVGQSGDWLERLFAYGQNPFISLMASVLVTGVVQSSSFTTALIITLVAAGDLPLETAVFAIMGANIGTSVTGILVSLGNIRIRRQFRRAFTAALVHDIFNLLTVAMLFPLEWFSSATSASGHGWLTRSATLMSNSLGLREIENPNSPVKILTRPLVHLMDRIGEALMPSPAGAGILIACIGLGMLFTSLVFMVKNLKGALLHRLDGLFRTIFFRNDATSYVIGVVTTILVQSSSITTSLIVPLAGAGLIKLKRVFAFMLGANLGTTVTGVIAATANPVSAAVTVALFHVSFNLIGTGVWYPLRRVPIGLAKWYGRLASESRRYAFLFLLTVFVIIPLLGVLITELLIR